MSYTILLYHIVIRTYNSEKVIDENYEKDLFAYILGFVKNKNSKLLRIGGMSDHLHLLV